MLDQKPAPYRNLKLKKTSRPIVKPKLMSALDHVERKSSTSRLSKFIDERYAGLDSLQDTENKYEKLFSGQSDGIFLVNAETKKNSLH